MALRRTRAETVIPTFKSNTRSGGVISGSHGRLATNSRSFPNSEIKIRNKKSASGVLKVNRGNTGLFTVTGDPYGLGDRICGVESEPTASYRSKEGFSGKIVFDTPTTVAPVARAAFAGGSADSVPTVTPMTASQSRIATSMHKKRMARRAGRHFVHPYNKPSLYDRNAPQNTEEPPLNEGQRRRLTKKDKSGNIKAETTFSGITSILEQPNQEDTDVTSNYPNPMEPLPPNNPVEQQGVQYHNFRGPLRTPQYSKNFPVLAENRGLDRNLKGKGPEMGPFDTVAESDARLEQVHGIVWG